MTRTYGQLYDRDRTVKDVAAAIRRQVRQMAKQGELPGDWKYQVRYRTVSQMEAIDITATSPRPIFAADPTRQEWVEHPETGEQVHGWADKLTVEAQTVRRLLDELHADHNHDGSDALTDYSDVKYYGRTELTTAPGVPEHALTQGHLSTPEDHGQGALFAPDVDECGLGCAADGLPDGFDQIVTAATPVAVASPTEADR